MADQGMPQRTGAASRSARSAGARLIAMFALPFLAVAGILGVTLLTAGPEPCGGPVPGCASLRNSGELPVTVQLTVEGRETSTLTVGPDERIVLSGAIAVWVGAGQCLTVAGGPLWDTRAVTDRRDDATGSWHPIDDWGARVSLYDGRCPGRS